MFSKIRMVWVLCAVFGFSLAALAHVYAQDKDHDDDESKLTGEQVPEAVMKTVRSMVPGGEFVNAGQETEDGHQVFEVVMKTSGGEEIEMAVAADGTLLENEQKISGEKLPAAVHASLNTLIARGKTLEIERKMIVVYEIKQEIGGKEYEVRISANGEIQSVEAEDDQD